MNDSLNKSGYGLLGYLWRTLLSVAIIVLVLWLLSLIPHYDNHRGSENHDTPTKIADPVIPTPIVTDPTKDSPNPGDQREPGNPMEPQRPVNPLLPPDDENRLPPIDDDKIIPSPDDSVRYIVNNKLNVLLEKKSENTMDDFVNKFKVEYPEDEYKFTYYNHLTYLLQIEVPPELRVSLKEDMPRKLTDFSFKVFDESVFAKNESKPNDKGFKNTNYSWYFDVTQCFEAWEITQGSPEVVVAIVDNYFDLSHPEFQKKNIVKPYSIHRKSEDVSPINKDDSHGTHVSATAIGSINNGVGVSGIAPNCSYMPVSVWGDSQFTSSMYIIEGLFYAVLQGADVVNLSVGSYYAEDLQNMPIEEQLRIIRNSGLDEADVWEYIFKVAKENKCVIVWAAGNNNIISGFDTSKRDGSTIRVSAVDNQLRKADFSNYGDFNDDSESYSTVSAPGVGIYSAIPSNGFAMKDGTSMAAPIVTGAVALMKSLNRSISVDEVIEILQKTGKPLNPEYKIGNLIQIKDALVAARDGFLNFDEVINDPSKIIGLWQCTDYLKSSGTSSPIMLFMEFTTENTGKLIISEEADELNFEAPLQAKFNKNTIDITQTDYARCTTEGHGTYYEKYIFECLPDKHRDLSCSAMRANSKDSIIVFNLKKIK